MEKEYKIIPFDVEKAKAGAEVVTKEVKYRKMTEQELAWWLRDCPEEHREWKWTSTVYVNTYFPYLEKDAHEECPEDILIRSNGEEWREPLIEIND